MKLTGKCKQDFEKWFFKLQNKILNYIYFKLLNESMQYGVLVDFFLEKTGKDLDKSTVYFTKGWGKEKARDKAIEEENEIYNERFNN